jgi:hypothetical protein
MAENNEEEKFQTQQELDATKPTKGRPTIYSKELADKICIELALGKSMRTVCAMIGMPVMSAVFRWLREYEEFREQYARAKEEAADLMVEDMLDIADETSKDIIETKDRDGNVTGQKLNKEAVLRSRLKVDTRKWIASKLKPKKYGEKLDLSSGGKPINHSASTAEIVSTVNAILEAGKNDQSNSNTSDSIPS